MSEHIQVEIADGVQTVRINRPEKKNALTAAMYAGLAAALDQAAADDAVRVTLILGTPGAFSAGNDIADFLTVSMSGGSDNSVVDFLERIIMAQKTVIAGVDGLAIGVGTTMLMHCDYVIASDQSVFKTPFVDLGLVPEAGSSLIGPQLFGHHRAFAMLALGEGFSSEEAREAGFVNRIAPSDRLEAEAKAAAKAIAAKPKTALEISRKLIRGDRTAVLERMREEVKLFGERLQSEEAKAAFMAFMAKGQKKAS